MISRLILRGFSPGWLDRHPHVLALHGRYRKSGYRDKNRGDTKSSNDSWQKDVTGRNVQVDPAEQKHAETQHNQALCHPEPAVDFGKNAASNYATDNCSDPSWAHPEAGLQRGVSKQKLQKHWNYSRCAVEDRANAEVQDNPDRKISTLQPPKTAHRIGCRQFPYK